MEAVWLRCWAARLERAKRESVPTPGSVIRVGAAGDHSMELPTVIAADELCLPGVAADACAACGVVCARAAVSGCSRARGQRAGRISAVRVNVRGCRPAVAPNKRHEARGQ